MLILGFSAESLEAVIILGFVFVVSIGIGANDSPTIFGTSVSARILSLPKAYLFASLFETLGVFLLGHHVLDTRAPLLHLPNYNQTGGIEVMYAEISVLIGCASWIILATVLKLPVSATHSIIGATIGSSLAIKGQLIMKPLEIVWIVASPLLAGVLSVLFHLIVDYSRKKYPNGHKASRIAALLLFGMSTSLFVFCLVYCFPKALRLDLSWYFYLLASVVVTVSAVFLSGLFIYLKNRRYGVPIISRDEQDAIQLVSIQPLSTSRQESADSPANVERSRRTASIVVRRPSGMENRRLFSVLQLITACFESLIHGAFAYSNVMLPLSGLYSIYSGGLSQNMLWFGTPALVAFGMILGILGMSTRVYGTVADKLSVPSRPLSIEIGNLLVLMVSLKTCVPTSTTLCKIVSIAEVGLFMPSFNWGPLKRIVVAWLLTIPMTGLISALALKALLVLQEIR